MASGSGARRRHQVVTLQAGTRANYYGAHFWNLLDERIAASNRAADARAPVVEPWQWFRETRSGVCGGQVYAAPRCVVVDAATALGALSRHGQVEGPAEPSDGAVGAWRGSVERVQLAAPVRQHEFVRDLHEDGDDGDDGVDDDDRESHERGRSREEHGARAYHFEHSVEYWSDYLQVHLHPRSFIEAPRLSADAGDDPLAPAPAMLFSAGERDTRLVRDIVERLRYFAEECDALGGFCVPVENDTACAGVVSSVLEHVADEFGGKTSVTVLGMDAAGVAATTTAAAVAREAWPRCLTEAMLFRACARYANDHAVYVPLRAHGVRDAFARGARDSQRHDHRSLSSSSWSGAGEAFFDTAVFASATLAYAGEDVDLLMHGGGGGEQDTWPVSARRRVMCDLCVAYPTEAVEAVASGRGGERERGASRKSERRWPLSSVSPRIDWCDERLGWARSRRRGVVASYGGAAAAESDGGEDEDEEEEDEDVEEESRARASSLYRRYRRAMRRHLAGRDNDSGSGSGSGVPYAYRDRRDMLDLPLPFPRALLPPSPLSPACTGAPAMCVDARRGRNNRGSPDDEVDDNARRRLCCATRAEQSLRTGRDIEVWSRVVGSAANTSVRSGGSDGVHPATAAASASMRRAFGASRDVGIERDEVEEAAEELRIVAEAYLQ